MIDARWQQETVIWWLPLCPLLFAPCHRLACCPHDDCLALLGALMIHKHPAPLLEISVLSPTWYWEDFDWLCIRCVLCLLVLPLSSLLYVYQTILICQDFSADTELQLAWPSAEVQRWENNSVFVYYSNTWGWILVFVCVFGWLFETEYYWYSYSGNFL